MSLTQQKNATAEVKTCTIQVLDVGTPGSFLLGQLSGRQEEFGRDCPGANGSSGKGDSSGDW